MLDRLLALSPSQFEDVVARLLAAEGYHDVERVGGAGDQQADVRCRDGYGRLVIVQCKLYGAGNRVTAPDIQGFFGMVVHHAAARGIFVTTSAFTKPAQELAAQRDIELIDGRLLAARIARAPTVREYAEQLLRRKNGEYSVLSDRERSAGSQDRNGSDIAGADWQYPQQQAPLHGSVQPLSTTSHPEVSSKPAAGTRAEEYPPQSNGRVVVLCVVFIVLLGILLANVTDGRNDAAWELLLLVIPTWYSFVDAMVERFNEEYYRFKEEMRRDNFGGGGLLFGGFVVFFTVAPVSGPPAGILAAFRMWEQEPLAAYVAAAAVIAWGIALPACARTAWATGSRTPSLLAIYLGSAAWYLAFSFSSFGAVYWGATEKEPELIFSILAIVFLVAMLDLFRFMIDRDNKLANPNQAAKKGGISAANVVLWAGNVVGVALLLYSFAV